MRNIEKSFLTIYILGFLLSFGWFYNNPNKLLLPQKERLDDRKFDKAGCSLVQGMMWPLYWSLRAAVEVTK